MSDAMPTAAPVKVAGAIQFIVGGGFAAARRRMNSPLHAQDGFANALIGFHHRPGK